MISQLQWCKCYGRRKQYKVKGLKRKHEELEVDEVKSLDESLSSASIHGIINPTKKGCKANYFYGSVSDGKSKFA